MNLTTGHAPQVTVIIVNWNGRQHLADCLPSLLATRYPNFRIMVLDNGSTDGSLAWLQETFPSVESVALGRNLGFAAANNAGIRIALAASMDYVVLLNNDTRVELDWLDELISVSETDPSIAICQARQRT